MVFQTISASADPHMLSSLLSGFVVDFKRLLEGLDNVAQLFNLLYLVYYSIVFIPYSVATKIIRYGRDLILNIYCLQIAIFVKKSRGNRLPHIH